MNTYFSQSWSANWAGEILIQVVNLLIVAPGCRSGSGVHMFLILETIATWDVPPWRWQKHKRPSQIMQAHLKPLLVQKQTYRSMNRIKSPEVNPHTYD